MQSPHIPCFRFPTPKRTSVALWPLALAVHENQYPYSHRGASKKWMVDPSSFQPITSVVILSPHRDDAAFSCGILMTLLMEQRVPVTILNVFTISAYAPYAPTGTSAATITVIRRLEDEALVRRLGPGAKLHDLAELDAPLRLHISESDVLAHPLSPAHFKEQVGRLVPRFRPLAAFDLVLLPLALGDHIDHQICRQAGGLAAGSDRIVYYEDLPYAARLPADSPVIERHTASLNATPFESAIISSPHAVTLKRELALLYPSQIASEVVEEMSAYAGSLGGAERLYTCSSLLIERIRATLQLQHAAPKPLPVVE